MTATLDTRSSREVPATRPTKDDGAPLRDEMSRPWRLAPLGAGLTLALVARLAAANGAIELFSNTMVIASALASALVAASLLLLAAERDRFGPTLLWLSGLTAAAFGALQWISPDFGPRLLDWDRGAQVALAILGVGNGALLAGVLTLAFVRRLPTLSVVAALGAAVLTLLANSVFLRSEWTAIAGLCAAFALMLTAWDQSPRTEVHQVFEPGLPRVSRAALSLATVAASGAGIQLWISRGEQIGRALPAVGICGALILAAFVSLVRVRREIQQRETTLSEWTSWMREIRTRTFQQELETSADSASVGELPGTPTAGPEPRRPLTFPDLRADDGSPFSDALTSTTRPADDDLFARTTQVADQSDTRVAGLPEIDPPAGLGSTPEIALPSLGEAADVQVGDEVRPGEVGVGEDRPLFDIPTEPLPWQPVDRAEPSWLEDPTEPSHDLAAEQSALFDVDDHWAPDDDPAAIGTSDVEPSGDETPFPSVDINPTKPAVTAGDSLAVAQTDEPSVDLAAAPPVADLDLAVAVADAAAPAGAGPSSDELPEAFTAPTPTPRPSPSVFTAAISGEHHAVTADTPPPTPRPTPASTASAPPPADTKGSFTSFLDDTPVAPTPSTLDALAGWLQRPSAPGVERLVCAVEVMSLADFDLLPAEVGAALVDAAVTQFGAIDPVPGLLVPVDGPYLFLAWEHVTDARLASINGVLLDLVDEPIDTSEGPVALEASVAFLRPLPGLSLDQLVDRAVAGLLAANASRPARRS